MLSEPEDRIIKVKLHAEKGPLILIMDTTDDGLDLNAEYDANSYTQEEVQAIADAFLNGVLQKYS